MSITAVDFIRDQEELERQAKELMPYSPDECTFLKGELRQPLFACVTCAESSSSPVGVCYSCLIQCHADHEIVELFTKRLFMCDCGTTRTPKACYLRTKAAGNLELAPLPRPRTGSIDLGSSHTRRPSIELGPGEDIPSQTNRYNHNYQGTFCRCKKPYNPLDGNMIQCYFGAECGEDWFHEECLLGYPQGLFRDVKPSKNMLDELEFKGLDAQEEKKVKEEAKKVDFEDVDATEVKNEGESILEAPAGGDAEDSNAEDDEVSKVPHFPKYSQFDAFICWQCVGANPSLKKLADESFVISLPHLPAGLVEEWNRLRYGTDESEEKPAKKARVAHPVNIFFKQGSRPQLAQLAVNRSEHPVLAEHRYLYEADPVYEPPEDEEDTQESAQGSLLGLGADALQSLPREQAIEGLQAYNKMREKLRDFFKPFAEKGEVVTEENVRDFFSHIRE